MVAALSTLIVSRGLQSRNVTFVVVMRPATFPEVVPVVQTSYAPVTVSAFVHVPRAVGSAGSPSRETVPVAPDVPTSCVTMVMRRSKKNGLIHSRARCPSEFDFGIFEAAAVVVASEIPPAGSPVQFVSVPLAGVPRAGATSVGEFARTIQPVPVALAPPSVSTIAETVVSSSTVRAAVVTTLASSDHDDPELETVMSPLSPSATTALIFLIHSHRFAGRPPDAITHLSS